ncbi:MAG: hypothetical protein ABW188_16260, partial [Rhodococcus fascians]
MNRHDNDRITLQGFPAANVLGATSLVTTLPAHVPFHRAGCNPRFHYNLRSHPPGDRTPRSVPQP